MAAAAAPRNRYRNRYRYRYRDKSRYRYSRFCRKPDGKSGICRFCRPLQKPGFPLPKGAVWARERWVFNAWTGSLGR